MQQTVVIFKRIFCSLVIIFLLLVFSVSCLLATFIYFFYQFVILTVGFVAVSLLIIFIRRSRHKLLRYPAIILTAGIIFYVSFLAIPEFKFLVTFNARQRIVNQLVNQSTQQSISTENSWLSETLYSWLDEEVTYLDNAIYFAIMTDPGKSAFSSRVFFVYTTRPELLDSRMSVKKLKKNWYLIKGSYAD